MYIRVTTFGVDESRFDEALEKMDRTIRDDLKAIAGLESVQECRIGDAQVMLVSVWESAAAAEAAQPRLQEIIGSMAEYITTPPEVKAGDVIWTM